ncbi:MAG: glycosyltransferase family 9 protein, partial [Pseudomonadota bacterium]
MSDPRPPVPPPDAPASPGPLARATRWWHSGFEIFRRDPALWLGMALLYILSAWLLKRIPFIGNFMLVLITPIPLAGAWLTARQLSGITHVPVPGQSWQERLRFYLGRPARALIAGFRQEVHALPLVLICPGARSHLKRWTVEGFAQVADRLIAARRAHVIFAGEPDEEPIVHDIQGLMTQRAPSAVGLTTIRQLSLLMQRADLVITN